MSKTDAVRAKIGKRVDFDVPKRLFKKGQPFEGFDRGAASGTVLDINVSGKVATAEIQLPKSVAGGPIVTIRVADIYV